MNIDIHIIINMNIEEYIDYYILLITIFQERIQNLKESMNLTFL